MWHDNLAKAWHATCENVVCTLIIQFMCMHACHFHKLIKWPGKSYKKILACSRLPITGPPLFLSTKSSHTLQCQCHINIEVSYSQRAISSPQRSSYSCVFQFKMSRSNSQSPPYPQNQLCFAQGLLTLQLPDRSWNLELCVVSSTTWLILDILDQILLWSLPRVGANNTALWDKVDCGESLHLQIPECEIGPFWS